VSRLTNPGLGDICDRLTILALKILHGVEGGRETQHWESERASLLAQVRSRELTGPSGATRTISARYGCRPSSPSGIAIASRWSPSACSG
jgi:hypothetical protein